MIIFSHYKLPIRKQPFCYYYPRYLYFKRQKLLRKITCEIYYMDFYTTISGVNADKYLLNSFWLKTVKHFICEHSNFTFFILFDYIHSQRSTSMIR